MLAALGATLAVAPGAQAAACTATWGGGTGSWHSANWTGGTEPEADDVVCITGGQVTLAGPQAEVLEVQLSGAGTTLIVDATYLFADDPATIGNPEEAKDGPVTVGAGATLRKTGDDSQIAGGTLLNQGTTHIAGGAGRTFRFSTSYANSGTLDVDVDQALALFGPSFTNTGTIDIAAGARLSADGVTFHQDAGQITGDGELEFSGGSLEHDGGNVAPSVTVGMAAGSIDPSGTGTATYSVGNGADSAGFTDGTKLTGDVAAGITLSILAGAFDRPSSEAKLALDADRTNHGTIELEQIDGFFGLTSILDVGGFTLTNTGTVSIPAASSGTRLITGTAFVNAAPGTVDVAHDTGFDVDVTNQGSFAIADDQTASSDRDVTQTGGTMTVDGWLEFTTDAALVLDGGALRGTGRVIGDLTNTGGVVDPGGPGEVVTMIVEGDYLQAAGGTLAADVAEGVADQLVAFGDASIAGALAVASAGYTPADADRFRVLEVDGTLSGTFATATGLAAGGGRTYWIEYEGTPGRVHLKVVPQFTVTVSKAGTGAGTVASAPAGIACGATCAARFDETATVTLTATAAAGSAFTGWSGSGCSGTGQCVVTTSEARAVTASFGAIPSGPPPAGRRPGRRRRARRGRSRAGRPVHPHGLRRDERRRRRGRDRGRRDDLRAARRRRDRRPRRRRHRLRRRLRRSHGAGRSRHPQGRRRRRRALRRGRQGPPRRRRRQGPARRRARRQPLLGRRGRRSHRRAQRQAGDRELRWRQEGRRRRRQARQGEGLREGQAGAEVIAPAGHGDGPRRPSGS